MIINEIGLKHLRVTSCLVLGSVEKVVSAVFKLIEWIMASRSEPETKLIYSKNDKFKVTELGATTTVIVGKYKFVYDGAKLLVTFPGGSSGTYTALFDLPPGASRRLPVGIRTQMFTKRQF